MNNKYVKCVKFLIDQFNNESKIVNIIMMKSINRILKDLEISVLSCPITFNKKDVHVNLSQIKFYLTCYDFENLEKEKMIKLIDDCINGEKYNGN